MNDGIGERGEYYLEAHAFLSANKGEWSEFYTFCYLINSGILETADKKLNPKIASSLPIIKITRDENGYRKEYFPDNDNKEVRIVVNGEFVKTVPKSEFDSIVVMLYQKMKGSELDNPSFQRRIGAFMESIRCTKIKAKPSEKEDIIIQLHDPMTNQSLTQGFSIKSYIGSKPTLLNAGKTTNFTFRIIGCDRNIMDTVNSIDSRLKIRDRINTLLNNGCSLEFREMDLDTFRRNLQKSDSLMPQIIAEMLRVHYMTGISKISDVVDVLEKNDPLCIDNPGFYVYKMKTVLCAFALGMIPSNQWNGIEDANGGYIVVKEDGNVVCFFLYDRNVFEDYLLENTMFERASTSRHDYLKVYENNGEFFIKLNLQIRFTKPSD